MTVNRFDSIYSVQCDYCGKEASEGFEWDEAVDNAKDEGFVYHEAENLCKECAEEEGLLCPECHNYKKPEYETCYDCKE